MKPLLCLTLLLAVPFRSPAPDTNPCPITFGAVNNLNFTTCTSTRTSFSVAVFSPCTNAITVTYSPTNGTVMWPGQSTNVIVTATNDYGSLTTNFTFSVVEPAMELICYSKTVTNGAAWSFDTPFFQLDCCAETNGYSLTSRTPVTNAGCPPTITRTWILADNCGITNQCDEVVTVVGPQDVPPGTGNYVVNGSFEQPALAGNGDSFSNTNSFSLPGWFYPKGSNQFFLEYGVPASAGRRYLDGRQAVCLNGQGTPVSLSQTFATLPGQNYLLSFGQSDASNAAPSLSELTVTVAGLSRVFSRSNDTGYVVKRWHFTATDYCTTLQFTDTTPPPNPSPFLDAVCVNPGSFLVADTFTLIPGGFGNFSSFGNPALSASGGAFVGTGSGQQGIYGFPSNPVFPNNPIKVADLTSAIPNGAGTFATFAGTGGLAGVPSISGGTTAFFGADSAWNEGIYTGDGVHPLQVVADTTTAIPGGSGNFTAFTGNWAYPGNPYISGQTVIFHGYGSAGQQGIYAGFPNQPIRVVADTHANIPSGSGMFTTFTTSSGVPLGGGMDGDKLVYWAGGASGQQGIYQFPADPTSGSPVRIADLNTAMPGGSGNFTDFVGDASAPVGPMIYDDNIAFRGSGAGGRIGVYASLAGTLVKVADSTTPIPGGMGMFSDFQAVSLSGDVVAVAATGPGGQMGIYVSAPANSVFPGTPFKVIDLNDTLDGKTITGLLLAPGGLSGDPLGFVATFGDGSQGVYVVPVVVEVAITSAAPTGSGAGSALQLSYTAPGGYNYTVQSRTNLVTGSWTTLPGVNYGNGSIQQFTVPIPVGTPRQFYRIQQSR